MHHACMREIEIFKVRWSQFSTLGENIRRWSTHFTVSTNTHWEIHPNVRGRQMVKGHVRLAKVWKAYWSWRGISHLRNISLPCQVLSHGGISLYPFELFVMQLFLWQCPDALDAVDIKDVCIKAGAMPLANILANHRESWRLYGRSFMQISFILIWKNKRNSVS